MEIEFLQTIFPDIDKKFLVEKLQQSSVENVLEELLNGSDNDSSEWEDIMTLKALFPQQNEELIFDVYMDKGLDESISYFAKQEQSDIQIVIPKRFRANYKVQDSNTVGFLTSMFPMFEPHDIECVLTYHSSDVEKTISTLSQYSDFNDDPRKKLSKELEILVEMFPLHSKRKLQQLWVRYGLDGAVDHLTKNEWSIPIATTKYPLPDMQISFNKPVKTISKPIPNTSRYQNPSDLRAKALVYLQKRNDCFQRACCLFKNGGASRVAASQFAAEGHEYTRLMNEANQEAARIIFEGGIQEGQVDLHGLTVRESKELLLDFLPTQRKKLKIITGAGHHSTNGGRLFQTLQTWLRSQGYQFHYGGNGWFFVNK